MEARSDGERWTMTNTGDPARTQVQILEWVEAGAFDWQSDVILVARNGETATDPCTVRGLNTAIVDMISPRDSKTKFRTGDRVINTKNLPALDVWNGTTGTVHAVDQDGGIWVRTDVPVIDHGKTKDERAPVYTEHVLFGRDVRSNLQLAYALTVHKAQGSQYRNVLVACFQRDGWGLLDRALLYTAVTRTKSACAVVGELAAVWAAIDKTNGKRTVMQILGQGAA
jgi:exodeoxyribonuclease V alpha subunit